MTDSNFTVKDTRGDPIHRFVTGQTIAFKVTNNSRFDLSTLFDTTEDRPRYRSSQSSPICSVLPPSPKPKRPFRHAIDASP